MDGEDALLFDDHGIGAARRLDHRPSPAGGAASSVQMRPA
jgi:hypothetical protein